jgi:hypothetical protein
MLNDSFYDVWPIAQFAIAVQARATDAWPIRRNDANTKVARWFVCESRHNARTWPAMAKHNRHSAWIAIFFKSNGAAVWELDQGFATHFETRVTCLSLVLQASNL